MTVPAVRDRSPEADEDAPPAPARPLRGGSWLTAVVVAGWAAVIVAARAVGAPNGVRWSVRAVPLKGSIDIHLTAVTILVLVVGIVLARALPGWCRRTPWRRMLLGIAAASLLWGLALGLTRGTSALDRGLGNRQEYPAAIEQVDRIGVGRFVDTFTDDAVLRRYPIHIQGHPLGAALLFIGLDRVGLTGPAGAAAFLLVASSSAIVAVLLTTREVAGADAARRAAPFLALLPGLVWWVTSADALFATVGAWGIALVVLATRPRASVRWVAALGLAGGIAWGLGIHLSYGLPPLALVALAVVVVRRRWSVLPWVALGAAAVVAAFVLGGFWWADGLAATRVRYFDGVASVRPSAYFGLLGNPAAFSLAIGPAAWVAVARVRERGLLLLAVPALAAVAIVDASGMSKAEVERIWLPFAPWIVLLAGGLAVRSTIADEGAPRASNAEGWPALASTLLAAQVVVAVAVESLVRTSW